MARSFYHSSDTSAPFFTKPCSKKHVFNKIWSP